MSLYYCWSIIVFLGYHSCIYNKDLISFWIPIGNEYLCLHELFFGGQYHLNHIDVCVCVAFVSVNTQEPSYLGKITLLSIWFKSYWPPKNNSCKQIYSHIEIPTKCQHLTRITNLVHACRFFHTIIDVGYWYMHSPKVHVPSLIYSFLIVI